LSVFKSGILERIFGTEREKVRGSWRKCIKMSPNVYTLPQISLRETNKEG
jgi:hypothetical protein